MGVYTLYGKTIADATKIWIIGYPEDAEHKRNVTIMFPEEY